MLRVQLCGPLVLARAELRVDPRLPGRQGRLLMAYLVLNRHRPTPRGDLVNAIWPQSPPGNADSGLSALLSKLRQALGPTRLEGRSAIQLAGEPVRVDYEDALEAVHRAESAIAARQWRRAWAPAQIGLFAATRGVLTGEEGDDEFEWITDERRRVAELELRALEAYGTACLGIGGAELPAAVRVGRRLVRAAPLRESGTRLLMRALAAEGNRAEALHVYEATRVFLGDELGIDPSEATRQLFAELNR